VTRTVYLEPSIDFEDFAPGLFGHSKGWFEGEILYIETTGFKPGVLLPHPGILHSDQMKLIERLAVDEKTGLLSVQWTATDPLYFSKPQTRTHYFARRDVPMGEFNCEL